MAKCTQKDRVEAQHPDLFRWLRNQTRILTGAPRAHQPHAPRSTFRSQLPSDALACPGYTHQAVDMVLIWPRARVEHKGKAASRDSPAEAQPVERTPKIPTSIQLPDRIKVRLSLC